MSNRMKRRMGRNIMVQAPNDVHEIFEEIADLMLLKFRDMDAAWKESEEWCKTLGHIKEGSPETNISTRGRRSSGRRPRNGMPSETTWTREG